MDTLEEMETLLKPNNSIRIKIINRSFHETACQVLEFTTIAKQSFCISSYVKALGNYG